VNYYEHWIGSYRKKTAGLTLAEHGAYRLLIDEYMAQEGPLPASISSLFRICSAMKKSERSAVTSVAESHFPIKPDGLRHNERCDEELSKRVKKIEAARENGAKGGRPRKENPTGSAWVPPRKPTGNPMGNPRANPGESSTNHKPQGLKLGVASQPVGLAPDGDPETEQTTKVNGNGAHHPAELGREARAILSLLNEKAGKRFPATASNIGIIVARLREGFTGNEVRQVVALKVRKWNTDPEMREFLRPATLFGRTKFSQYVGELEAPDEDGDGDGLDLSAEQQPPERKADEVPQ
jgi:uncharacterized phage protein (TIGR02220 family)